MDEAHKQRGVSIFQSSRPKSPLNDSRSPTLFTHQQQLNILRVFMLSGTRQVRLIH